MKKEEFDNLNNTDKVNFLNEYVGRSNDFKNENDFSWTYATTHTNYIKKDGRYMEETFKKEVSKIEIIYSFRTEEKKKVSLQITENNLKKLEEEKKRNGLSKTEIINYLLYKYFNSEGDQDE